jgi:hypothetical protein
VRHEIVEKLCRTPAAARLNLWGPRFKPICFEFGKLEVRKHEYLTTTWRDWEESLTAV